MRGFNAALVNATCTRFFFWGGGMKGQGESILFVSPTRYLSADERTIINPEPPALPPSPIDGMKGESEGGR